MVTAAWSWWVRDSLSLKTRPHTSHISHTHTPPPRCAHKRESRRGAHTHICPMARSKNRDPARPRARCDYMCGCGVCGCVCVRVGDPPRPRPAPRRAPRAARAELSSFLSLGARRAAVGVRETELHGHTRTPTKQQSHVRDAVTPCTASRGTTSSTIAIMLYEVLWEHACGHPSVELLRALGAKAEGARLVIRVWRAGGGREASVGMGRGKVNRAISKSRAAHIA